eukprot:GILK01011421.1.p1 GENE.GILK01011421.1~~GILK01011421.1.p1  ORF type:complete len:145 (+),score=11.15 GILK01011421.1:134-568(+)
MSLRHVLASSQAKMSMSKFVGTVRALSLRSITHSQPGGNPPLGETVEHICHEYQHNKNIGEELKQQRMLSKRLDEAHLETQDMTNSEEIVRADWSKAGPTAAEMESEIQDSYMWKSDQGKEIEEKTRGLRPRSTTGSRGGEQKI